MEKSEKGEVSTPPPNREVDGPTTWTTFPISMSRHSRRKWPSCQHYSWGGWGTPCGSRRTVTEPGTGEEKKNGVRCQVELAPAPGETQRAPNEEEVSVVAPAPVSPPACGRGIGRGDLEGYSHCYCTVLKGNDAYRYGNKLQHTIYFWN